MPPEQQTAEVWTTVVWECRIDPTTYVLSKFVGIEDLIILPNVVAATVVETIGKIATILGMASYEMPDEVRASLFRSNAGNYTVQFDEYRNARLTRSAREPIEKGVFDTLLRQMWRCGVQA